MKSPCKTCDRHSSEFPNCLEGCVDIAEFQQSLLTPKERSLEQELYTVFSEFPVAPFPRSRGYMELIRSQN